MITNHQLPQNIRNIIDNQVNKFKEHVFTEEYSEIPTAGNFPTEQSNKWFKIKNVICVFVDMKNSTKLSATHHATSTAKAYTLFTGTAVRIFHEFGAPYIDIKGDGVFALFNASQTHVALAAAVSFRTFAQEVFKPKVANKTEVDVGSHIGIDQATLLVSKIGLRRNQVRSDKHNEVWAGKAVNMAAKLSSLSSGGEIYVSDRFFKNIKHPKALNSCGCGSSCGSQNLWSEKDLTFDDRFSFNKAHILESIWCRKHGTQYLGEIIDADK